MSEAGYSVITHDPLQDGISKLRVVSYLGDDRMIAECAWVDDPDFPPLPNRAGDTPVQRIIKYMLNAKPQHKSPFYQPQLHMFVKMPLFVLRQAERQTIGWQWPRNEESRRYKDNDQSPFEFYVPADCPRALQNPQTGLGGRDRKLRIGPRRVPGCQPKRTRVL
jgi:hypothetical protein